METRDKKDLELSVITQTLFKHAIIPQPDLGQIELYFSVSKSKQTVKYLLLAFPRPLTDEDTGTLVKHTGEYALSENDVKRLFQDIEDIFKEYPHPEQQFDSFNISDDSDSANKKSISRVEATGISVTHRYLEKMFEIQKNGLLSQVKTDTQTCRIF
jgi:hypothetical protein